MKLHALLLTLLGELGCVPRPPALAPGIELNEPERAAFHAAIHVNDGWWPARARQLGTSELEARARDARAAATHVPAGFWDTQTALEAVSVWTVLCNQCHGGRRRLDDVDAMPPPPPGWGEGTGVFFGNRRRYSDLFDVVHDGQPPQTGTGSERAGAERAGPERTIAAPSRPSMPAWRGILSNEMIWALLYFLEFQSVEYRSLEYPAAHIEGHFRPSPLPEATEASGAVLGLRCCTRGTHAPSSRAPSAPSPSE